MDARRRLTLNTSQYFTREDCRLCGGRQLISVLELAPTPPANAFVDKNLLNKEQPLFPLNLYFCESCGHVQLLTVVNPEVLFREYVYVSGTSPTFVKHFSDYAESLHLTYGFVPAKSPVVEIGSNDGTLLEQFRRLGYPVLGVDPAQQIADAATKRGLKTLAKFFSADLAVEIKSEFGPARIICANNVFAHADNLKDILAGVRTLLSEDGLFVFEVSYLLDVYEGTLFDTIYHEHLAYHSVKPLVPFFANAGLELIDVQRVPTHGGSIRGTAQLSGSPHGHSGAVTDLIVLEEAIGLDRAETFIRFGENIQKVKNDLTKTLSALKSEGKSIAGYGAPAKATTLMHHFGLDRETIDFIVDDSEFKQNLYSPGLHIPVRPSEVIGKYNPDCIVILAWNFAEPILAKLESFIARGGKVIIPLPELRTI